MAAVCATVAMGTERSCTTAQDGQQNLAVLPGEPALTAVQKGDPCTADDIGHLQRWTVHA